MHSHPVSSHANKTAQIFTTPGAGSTNLTFRAHATWGRVPHSQWVRHGLRRTQVGQVSHALRHALRRCGNGRLSGRNADSSHAAGGAVGTWGPQRGLGITTINTKPQKGPGGRVRHENTPRKGSVSFQCIHLWAMFLYHDHCNTRRPTCVHPKIPGAKTNRFGLKRPNDRKSIAGKQKFQKGWGGKQTCTHTPPSSLRPTTMLKAAHKPGESRLMNG